MKKFSLILLLLMVVGAALPAFAVPQPPVFDAMYWVKGTTVTFNQDKDGNSIPPAEYATVPTEQRDVIFYKNLPGTYLSTKLTETGPNPSPDPLNNGKYMINIYDAAGLSIIPQGIYSVAVPRGKDDFGADPVEVTVTGDGFETAGVLKIVKGAGPILPLPGAVQLFISRSGNDIKLSWDTAQYPAAPEIFMMKNDVPLGVFSDNPALWSKPSPALELHLADGYYLHKDQSEKGLGEAYYKALENGLDKTSTYQGHTGSEILQSGWGVGKVNVTVAGGKKWTAFSLPFLLQSQDINTLIGKQGSYPGTSNSDDDVLLFSWENGAWNKASYFDGNVWQSLTPSPAVYDGDKGLYILTRPSDTDKAITVIGDVKKLTEATDYTITPNLNLFSFPYPKQFKLTQIALNIGKGAAVSDNADIIFGWKDGSWNIASYLNTGKAWISLTPTGVDLLDVAKPVLYLSRSTTNVPYKLTPSAQGYQ